MNRSTSTASSPPRASLVSLRRVARTGWETVARYGVHARILWRSAPGWVVVQLVLAVALATSGTVLMVATGAFLGALSEAAAGTFQLATWWWLGAVGVCLIATPVLDSVSSIVTQIVTRRYFLLAHDLLAEASLKPDGLERLDRSGYAGQLEEIGRSLRDWRFALAANSTWQMIALRLSGVGAIVVLASWRWWVPLIVAAGFIVLSVSWGAWANKAFDGVLEASSGERRAASYVRGLMSGSRAGKEIRLFGLADWLLDRYRTVWTATMQGVWRDRNRALRPAMAATIGVAVVVGGALSLLVRDAAVGRVGVAVVITMAQAVLALGAFGPEGDWGTAVGYSTTVLRRLGELRKGVSLSQWKLDAAPDREPIRATPDSTHPGDQPSTPAAEVTLDSVTFTYPSRTEPSFNDLDLHIDAGESVAIVGPNGAGKSTIVKLLCGLYQPDGGTIRIDGKDPRDLLHGDHRVAVIFQNFVRYHLTLRENVVLGATSRSEDTESVQRALAAAGADEILADDPDRLDIVLSAEYEGGTNLSGGQWQRVALARALAATAGGAGLLILDEPTAALDVRAEAALFERFLDVTRGVTTILVSHRLSSVRHADRIVVVDRGIVESGTHEELMAADGHYAEMFELQARRFSRTDEEG